MPPKTKPGELCKPPLTHIVSNSTSKLESFSGCDDIKELNTNSKNTKITYRTSQKLQNLFKYRRKSNKKQHNNKSKPLPISTTNTNITWRPSLQIIYHDELLLKTLIEFMEKAYNSENIFFILSVRDLQIKFRANEINNQIVSIYNLFINSNAEYPINISHDCRRDILSKLNIFNNFTIKQKHCMFDLCVTQIETLMITSILPGFYSSKMFYNIAKKCEYYGCNFIHTPPPNISYSPYSQRNKLKITNNESFNPCNSINNNYNKFKPYKMRENCESQRYTQPILVRNRRYSITCSLRNSVTEISKDVDIDEDF